MLKPSGEATTAGGQPQPPSGGCVLKHFKSPGRLFRSFPAAFGRLCVETVGYTLCGRLLLPAAFGRLCVETAVAAAAVAERFPAAFGRLCVET